MEENNFNDLFRDRFKDFEINPVSDNNWDAIQSGIPKKKSFLNQYRKSSFLLLLLLVSTCLYRYNSLVSADLNYVTENKNNNVKFSEVIPMRNTTGKFFYRDASILQVENSIENKSFVCVGNSTAQNYVQPKRALFNTFSAPSTNFSLTNYVRISQIKSPAAITNSTAEKITAISATHNLINANLNVSTLEVNASPLVAQTVTSGIEGKETSNVNPLYSDQTLKFTEQLPLLPTINSREIKNSAENKIVAINLMEAIAVKKSARISYFFSVSPQYSFYSYTPNTTDKILITNFESPNSFSTDRLGFTLGSGFSYKFNDNWQFNVGLNATRMVKNITYAAQGIVPDSFKIGNRTAFTVALDPVMATNIAVEQSTYYLIGFNPSVQYTTQLKNRIYFATAGASYNQLLNGNKSHAVSLDFSIGMQQRFNDTFNWSIAPKLSTFLPSDIFSTSALQSNPYTVGLQFMLLTR